MNISIALACIFKVILINTQHCMNGEADNSRFVSMYAYLYLAFKELINSNCQLNYTMFCLTLKNVQARHVEGFSPNAF